ncbi:MAG: ABC transporter substrate-binding protein, partial [Burkholderiales bacterium]
ASAADTIKVGLLPIDSGMFARNLPFVVDSAKLAVEVLNAQGGAAGKKFELVIQNHPGTPASAMAAGQRLIQQEGAQYLTGFFTSSIAGALSPKMAGMNALLIDPVSLATDLIGKNCQPNYFRVSAPEGLIGNAFHTLLRQTGAKTWSTISHDFAAGHAFASEVKEVVGGMGGSVQKSFFTPIGTTDFGSYITQLAKDPTEALGVALYGSDALAFAKQQQQFGLFAKFKAVVSQGFADELTVGAQGDSTVGVVGTQNWSATLPGAKVAAFVKAYEERYKRRPNYVEADMYAGFEMLQAAINKAKSSDVNAVRIALAGLKAETVLGEVEMRAADHQLVRPITLIQVVKGADGTASVAVKSVISGRENTPPPSADCKMPS